MTCNIKNPKHKYKLQESPIECVESHKDIGIIISHDLKSNIQCSTAAQNINRALGMIARTFKNKNKSNILKL